MGVLTWAYWQVGLQLTQQPATKAEKPVACLKVLSVTHPCSPKGSFASEEENERITSKKGDAALSLQDFMPATFKQSDVILVTCVVLYWEKKKLSSIKATVGRHQGIGHVFLIVN